MSEHFSDMRSLAGSLAEALNLIDSSIENHHQQTAYLAHMIAQAAGFDQKMRERTVNAALTHDIGFITIDEPGSVAAVERQAKELARIGAAIIEGFPHSAHIADIVRFSQTRWEEFLSLPENKQEKCGVTARIASVVHLADTVSTVIRTDIPILNQVKEICTGIASLRDKEFSAEAVDAFLRVSENEFIWMDLRYNPQFLSYFTGTTQSVSLDETVELTKVISRVIDYRSAFTAMHSAGVSASAAALARLAGMTGDECKMMRIAGYMHDIGKLKVPRAILEKPGKLTEEEFNIIKEHPYYTRLNTMNVEGFEKISMWAGFHHEKLNGKGYPFHIGGDQLDTGSRIMAVADIFSAITEIRPYRAEMSREQAMNVLNENVRSGGIDGDLVALLNEHYEEINRLREEAAQTEGNRYYESIGRIQEDAK